ncbi:phosphoribosylformylglycinamidine synthase [uncultured archaeon]|nr:phosphoribosylformylglycinamidine synthase [uncultured archaeon]
MEGTNNEEEALLSFKRSGASPEYVHINDLSRGTISFDDFDGAIIPGGFSAGDYVRGGAIFAARLMDSSREGLRRFIEEEKPLIGVCNGFQVLAETGMLPDLDGDWKKTVTLTFNRSNRFECRFTYMKRVGSNKIFSEKFEEGRPYQVPVAHAEGRVVIKDEENNLPRMIENDQILFKYTNKDGTSDEYPWNPNGSVQSIASITNTAGNVIGLMPHPERVYYGYQMIGTERDNEYGTGKIFYDSLVNYMSRIITAK